ncbi:MAG TPA: hypothetical protein VG722_05660 [Tepidisphaeraceae bacterium]|nr:hypothetical protein [Tepidisphaeraceae bacterium]
MSVSVNDSELLTQARQRIERLTKRLEQDRRELAGRTKLDPSAAGMGRAALKSVTAALDQMDQSVERAMQRKEIS